MANRPLRSRSRLRQPASLRTKLGLGLAGVFLLLAAVLVALTATTGRLYLAEAQQELHRDLAGNIVHEKTLMAGGLPQTGTVKDLFMMLMVVNPSIEVYLLDPDGKILSYSAPPGRVVRERVSLGPVRAFLAGERLPILGDDPRSPSGRKIFTAAPIEEDGSPQGFLYVVLAGERHDSVFGLLAESWILRLGAWTAVGCLALAGLVTLWFVRRVTRPLVALAGEMDTFARAELAAADGLPAVEGDEVVRLRARFEAMAQRIRLQIAELAGTDRARRELVAGVSHDLRTPLTHLQGYLETLLMKDDLEEPRRREYLEIAYQECLRLARLVGDLFELAKLETLRAPVSREVFSLAELAHDVTQKFRLAALKKGVDLGVEGVEKVALVDADLRLVERVLENLLDNAIRHTPAGGRVSVGLAAGEGGIEVAVRDTGAGIPPEELPHVFDRFYRGRRGARTPGDGAGLGLAIARRAVELHAGELRCDSAPGAGTTFRFGLPAPVARPRAS